MADAATGETGGPSGDVGRGARMSRGRFLVSLLLCIVGIAILAWLGTWQIQRLAWKEDLLATIDARRHAEPISLPALRERAAAGEPIDYVPVRIEGRFLNGDERYFFSTFDGQSGWNVYTPLRTSAGDLLMVNRGFVPYDHRDPGTRPASQPGGEVRLTGLARAAPPEKPGFFVPDNQPDEGTYYWRDLHAMAAGVDPEAGEVLPFFVDAARAPAGTAAARRLPIGGTTQVTLPNNHLQYALTWYGLAAVLAIMTGWFVVRHFRARPADERTGSAPSPPSAHA